MGPARERKVSFLASSFLLAVCICHPALARSQDASVTSNSAAPPQFGLYDISPSSHDPEIATFERMARNQDFASARSGLQGYLSAHPQSAIAHFLMGYVLYRMQQPTASLAEYTLGAKLRRPGAGDIAVVAMDYILLHDYVDADKWLTQAVTWEPNHRQYWYYLGRTKYAENRFQEAIDAFEKCLSLQPRDGTAEYNIGLAYAGLGNTASATLAYQQAIDWQHNAEHQDPQPYLDLGILLLTKDESVKALPYLKSAAQVDGKNPKAHEELGIAYEKLRQFQAAQSELELAISLAQSVPALHFELGRVYQKEGLTSQAKAQFAKCAALNATHSSDEAETPNLFHHE